MRLRLGLLRAGSGGRIRLGELEPDRTQCLQNRPSTPTGQVHEKAGPRLSSQSRTRYCRVPRTDAEASSGPIFRFLTLPASAYPAPRPNFRGARRKRILLESVPHLTHAEG